MAKQNPDPQAGFEQSIARLEEIIRETDSPATELEKVISLVEEGAGLIRRCKNILKQAELRIETLENPEEEIGDSEEQPRSSQQNDASDGTSSFSLN